MTSSQMPPDSAGAGSPSLTGIVAATFTPFDSAAEINLDLIQPLTDHLVRNGVSGIYICGSTGEGPSLTMEERKAVVEAYVKAAKGRLRTVVHIGHTAVKDAAELGAHAESVGADAISAIAPYYFKPEGVPDLIAFLKEAAAAAPSLPFYYYHMPSLTGVAVDPVEFLRRGAESIPTLRGIKYTDADLSKFNACQELAGGERFDVLFGRDEMLLSGLVAGARGAVGSTYNFAPALYRKIIEAFEARDLEKASELQRLAVRMIRAIVTIGGEAAIKHPMRRLGLDCGLRRLPMRQLNADEERQIDAALDALGFDEWATERVVEGAS